MLSTAAFVVCSYATNAWLARHLGVSSFGTLGLVTSFMAALNVMQVSGVPQAVSKCVAEDPGGADDTLWAGLKLQTSLSVALMLITFAAAPLFARIWGDAAVTRYLVLIAFVFPGYGAFALYGGYYNGSHRFARQAAVNGSYAVAKVLLVIGLAIPYGLVGGILGYALAPMAAVLVGLRRPHPNKAFPIRRLVAISGPLVGFAGLALLQYSIDLFSVKALLHSKASTGFYVAAQSISVIPFLGLAALGQVLFPNVSRLLAADDAAEAARAVRRSVRYLLALLLPATALIAGSAPALIRILYGRQYAGATGALRLLVISYVAVTVFSLFANILNGGGRARVAMALAASGLLTTFALCLALIPPLHLLGAAAATGVGASVATVGAVVAAHRLIPFSVNVTEIALISLTSGVLVCLAWLPVPWWATPAWWVLLALIYGASLLGLGVVTAEEHQRALALARAVLDRTKL